MDGSTFFGGNVSASDSLIRLSTTVSGDQAGQLLNPEFAANIGTDVQTVFSGPLTLTTNFANGPGGTRQFDYTITFMTPFQYNPAMGNLLLEVSIPTNATVSGSGSFGFVTFDNVNTPNDGIGTISDINHGGATQGQFSTAGAIASFQTSSIPEPSSLMIGSAALCGLILQRSRNV